MTFKKTILPNGLRIITVPMKGNPAVTVLVLAQAGSKYETKDISGLSHFLEHMCFKGTLRRPHAIDISRELDSIGAQYNAFTSQEYTGYYVKSHSKHLTKILDVISDMYLNPIFDEKEIQKEKGVIIEEINMYEDTPQRHVWDVFNELVYGDQPAGWNIAGTKEIVSKMTRDDFIKYRAKHYVAKGTTVIVAGDIEEDEVSKNIADLFKIEDNEKHQKVAVKEKQEKPQLSVVDKKTDQVHLVLGVRTFGVNHPDQPILRVLCAVLGGGMSGRLFQKLRDEMGVGYYARASIDDYTDHGLLVVSTGVDTKRVKEVVTAILDEFKKFITTEVPAPELEKAKEYLLGSLYLDLETSDAVASFFGMQDILQDKINTPEDISLKINAVTAQDIKRLAGEIFKDKSLNAAFIGHCDREDLASALTLNT